MDEIDFKHLEILLGKLRLHLGCRYCIVPEVVQDGIHIGVYDDNGNLSKTAIGSSLSDAVAKIKTQ